MSISIINRFEDSYITDGLACQGGNCTTGLVYLRARYYDPYLNQFIQPDTIVPDPSNPQDWNRYTYARNNPLKYTDPTGYSPYGQTPDYDGLAIVQYYKFSFDMWEPYINSKGLHKTTIAAAIAVQSEWRDRSPDMIKNFAYEEERNGNCNSFYDWILKNGSFGPASVGFAKEHPSDKYGDLNIMSESILAMTDRIAKSTDNCPNCKAKDKLYIAGMAQNGGGFSFEKYQQDSIPNKGFMKENGEIDWNLYFSKMPNLNGSLPATSPNNIWNNIRTGGKNYNSYYQLQLFTQDMSTLR